MAIKIALDASALTKILDEVDDEVLLDIRAAVLNQCIEKRMKSMVPFEVEKIVDAAVRGEVAATVGTVNYREVKLNERIKERITKSIASNVDVKIRELVRTQVEESVVRTMEGINDYIDRVVNHTISQEVISRVKAKFDEVIGDK